MTYPPELYNNSMRKKSRDFSVFVLLVIAILVLSFGVVRAALTLDATSVVSDGAVTVRGAAGSAIIVGHAAQTGQISIASSSGALTLDLAIGDGAKTINIGTGTSGNTVNIATGANSAASTVSILSGASTSGDQTLNLATGDTSNASTKVVSIGTGAAATSTIAIGNSNAATTLALTGGDDWSVNAAGAGTLVSLNLGTTAVSNFISATTSRNFAAPASPNSCQDADSAVTGAAQGDTVVVNPGNFNPAAHHLFYAFASSTNAVTIRNCYATSTAPTDPDGGAGSPFYRITIIKF